MYRPAIASAKTVVHMSLGRYSATLLDEVESAGLIQYGYVMEFTDESGQPCFFVAAEVNDTQNVLGGGSHFLCSYLGGEHFNHGDSDDWTDVEKFTSRAVQLFLKEFGDPA